MDFDAYTIVATGTTVTSGAASANAAIPTDASGNTPRYVLLTGSATLHVKLGKDNTVTATANDLMVGTVPIVVNTRGQSYIAYIQETASAKLNVAPIEA